MNVSPAQRSAIDRLIDQVTEAAASDGNRARGHETPRAVFGMEEPVGGKNIFHRDIDRYFTDPAYYFEQTLRQKLWRWEQFPDDDLPISLEVPAWLGHYVEYTFLGIGLEYEPSGVPRIQSDHPLTRNPDVSLLKPVDFRSSGWMPRILRWYDDLRALADGRLEVCFNMFWWRGCLDLAIQLRGCERFLEDTVERPSFVHDLLGFLTEQRCRWHAAHAAHFGVQLEAAGVADDWINVPFITPTMFEDFVLPRYLEIERFHGGIASLHSCGNQGPVQQYLLQIESLPCLEVSPWTDLDETLANVPPTKSLHVSIHPNDVLCATRRQMEAQLVDIVTRCRGRRYNIGTSGLTPLTDDIEDFVRRIRNWTEVAASVMQTARTAYS